MKNKIISKNKVVPTTKIQVNNKKYYIKNYKIRNNALYESKINNNIVDNFTAKIIYDKIFHKSVISINNKINTSKFINEEDILLNTYYNELLHLKKELSII